MKGIPYYIEHDITQPYQGAPMSERITPSINLFWYPQPDITIYELALLVRYASGVDRPTPARFEQFPAPARRHFQLVYDAADPRAAAWVEKWGWKGAKESAGAASSDAVHDRGRDLVPTLNEVLAQIPTGEKSLIARLTSIRGSAEFAPPEGMGHWWNEAAAVLKDEIGTPSTEWQRTVESIFSGRRPLPDFIPEEPVSVMPDAPESYRGTNPE